MSEDLMAERLKEQARKLRPFLEEIDRLEASSPDNGADSFRLPYTAGPKKRPEGFRLTFPA